jgi:hypothetical protein
LGLFRRDISVEVEEEDGGVLLMRGRLADRRGGEDLHVIEVEMRVAVLSGAIIDVSACMPAIPMEECAEALAVVRELEGMVIKPGFSDAVKGKVGSEWGCTHLAGLIMNMGNVSVQGRAAYARKNFDEGQAARRLAENAEELGLLNSCVCWREDGPVVRRWREQQQQALEAGEPGRKRV